MRIIIGIGIGEVKDHRSQMSQSTVAICTRILTSIVKNFYCLNCSMVPSGLTGVNSKILAGYSVHVI